tara:strand:- start:377 stop:1033 length:657 start_codon:yes stop_codon:yes gene_type:complete
MKDRRGRWNFKRLSRVKNIVVIKKRMIYISLAIAVTVVTYFGWKLTARSQYESAEYTVLKSDGVFEIRQYSTLMMVTTNMKLEAQGDDGSFMRLFRYISGENEGDQKVAMTTPVFMESDEGSLVGRMGFVIPRKVAENQIPEPFGNQVQIRERSGGRFAVISFNGRLNSDSSAAAEERLRGWIKSRGLQGKIEVESAGYDPPWTPGPLRRNEVLIRLQ